MSRINGMSLSFAAISRKDSGETDDRYSYLQRRLGSPEVNHFEFHGDAKVCEESQRERSGDSEQSSRLINAADWGVIQVECDRPSRFR